MPSAHARERALAWTLIGATALVAVVASADAWQGLGSITPGFNLMANLQIGVGDRGGGEPFGQALRALTPAVFTHLALTFPERRAIARRRPLVSGTGQSQLLYRHEGGNLEIHMPRMRG